MDSSLILIIVLTFAFAATHLEERFLGQGTTLLASLEYLLIGVIVGPVALGFLDSERLDSLEPLLAVVTGFAGFLVGLPLRIRRRQRPKGTFRFAIVAGTLAAGIVFALAYAGLSAVGGDIFGGVRQFPLLVGAATLGLGAAITALEPLLSGIRANRADGPVSRLLPNVAEIIRVIAILGFGLTLASYRADDQANIGSFGIVVWDAIAVGAGIGFGFIFHVFVGNEQDHKKLFVATIGVVALASGTAHALGFSPLFVNLVAGATIANLSRATPDLLVADNHLRRPVFVVLLLLAGASWTPIPAVFWLVPLAFVVIRPLALRLGARVAVHVTNTDVDTGTPRLGHGLLSQGALVAAVAVNYQMVVPATESAENLLANVVMTTLLVSAVVNELWASKLLRQLLLDAGEIGRAPDVSTDVSTEATPDDSDDVSLTNVDYTPKAEPEVHA
ncbi:MAG: hypothetical protein ACI9MR_000826 [Myxococcota bacterium]